MKNAALGLKRHEKLHNPGTDRIRREYRGRVVQEQQADQSLLERLYLQISHLTS